MADLIVNKTLADRPIGNHSSTGAVTHFPALNHERRCTAHLSLSLVGRLGKIIVWAQISCKSIRVIDFAGVDM